MATDKSRQIDDSGLDLVVRSLMIGPVLPNSTAGPVPGQFQVSTLDNVTAHAGGTQALGVLMSALINRVTTVGTAADSVTLPVSASGMSLTVINAAAVNAMNLFPAVGDAINALGANNAFSVAAGKTVECYCCTAGQWHTILSA